MFGGIAARGATTFTVTTTADGDDGSCTASQCTLRDAIKYSSAGDTVTIPAAGQPYSLTLGELKIDHNLTVNGAGATGVTITANDSSRVFEISPGTTATISGVTVTHGNGTGGTISDGNGGAIGFSGATVTLVGSVVSNSTASNEGGGIYDAGTMTLEDSTISGNTADGGNGGGIAVEDELHLSGSTINGNHAVANPDLTQTGQGGGIYNDDTTFITNSTIQGNTADTAGGGVYSVATTFTNATLSGNSAPPDANGLTGGSNVFVNDTTSGGFQNTIVANPQGGGGNCYTSGVFPSSQGNNLEDDSGQSCQFTDATDQSGVNPELGPLADNGGPTQTMALTDQSPAIDHGAAIPSVTTDQRGVSRPQGPAYDIGAFEVQVSADMGITKSASPNPVTVGQTLTYTLTATNHGPGSAPGATLSDTLPSSVTFKSASASQGSCANSSGKVTCSLGTIGNGSTATVTITVTPNSPGTITNTATVSSSAPDGNSANDSASVTTQVTAAAVAAAARPVAVTGGASVVGFHAATLHGSVNPKGASTTYFFEYGTSTHYGSSTSGQSAGSGSASRSVSRRISGLRPGTLYHYRIVAQNANGTADGSDRTFRTPQRASLHVRPARVLAGARVRVFGDAGGCPRGDRVTLLSHAFSTAHEFAGVPAVFATVGRGGAFSTTTRIPATRLPARYTVTARCGGGNLGVSAFLTVFRLPVFTG